MEVVEERGGSLLELDGTIDGAVVVGLFTGADVVLSLGLYSGGGMNSCGAALTFPERYTTATAANTMYVGRLASSFMVNTVSENKKIG